MLLSRRNHGNQGLLQDATRAGGRVAEQAQQTLSGLAEDSKDLAQTARSELTGIGREVRGQASGKVTRARKRTARKLSQAADAVEPNGDRRRGKPVLKAVLAAVAGWVLVNVVRKARQKSDEDTSTGTTTATASGTEPTTSGTTPTTKAGGTEKADKPKAKNGSETTPTTGTTTRANASS